MNDIEINKWMSSGLYEHEKEYWTDKLTIFNIFESLAKFRTLSEDKGNNRIAVKTFCMQDMLYEKLLKICGNSEVSMLAVMLTGICYLAGRLNDRKKVTIGMPVFLTESKAPFNLGLPICAELSKDMNFKQFLMNMRQTVYEANENSDYPIHLILEQLQYSMVSTDRAVYKTIVIFDGIHDKRLFDKGEFEIAFYFTKKETKLNLRIYYRKDRYTETEILRLKKYLLNYLHSVLTSPDITLGYIPLLGEDEKRKIQSFNQTELPYPRKEGIHHLFEAQSKKQKNHTAVIDGGTEITYEELNRRADIAAGELIRRGMEEGEFVGVLIKRSADFLVAILGILKAGGAYVPIEPALPKDRIHFMLSDSGIRFVICSGQLREELNSEKNDITYIVLKELLLLTEGEKKAETFSRVRAESAAYMIYTSGSTGRPKGVVVEHKAAVNFIFGMKNLIGFEEGRSILNITTVSFDIFFLETLLPLTLGMKVIIAEKDRDYNGIAKLIQKYKIDMIQATPSRLRLMLMDGNISNALKTVKVIMIGGEVFPKELLKQLKETVDSKIYNMYGPTETTIWSTVCDLTVEEEISIGRPIANTGIYIADSMMQMQPIGIAGELCIAGDGLAREYYNRKELTNEKFIQILKEGGEYQRLYRTGDTAFWREDGNIGFIGRRDNQIKHGGYRIELSEIEYQLKQHPLVTEAAAVSRDIFGETVLIAYIQSKEYLTYDRLHLFLAKSLPDYMIPQTFIETDEFLLTSNGKIDRNALNNLPMEHMIGLEGSPCKTGTELKLYTIWEKLLHKKQLSPEISFFEMGGNSVLASAAVLEIYKQLNLNVTLGEFFENDSIRKLGDRIDAGRLKDYELDIDMEVSDCYPLSKAQQRIYVLEKIEPCGISYNMPSAILLQGSVDIKRLELALSQLVMSCDVLRTTIHLEEQGPVQRIEVTNDIILQKLELNGRTAEEAILSFIKPFELEKAPLFRIGLLALDSGRYMLITDIHHLIGDGKSSVILLKLLMKYYYGAEIPEKLPSYQEYVHWAAYFEQTDYMAQQEKFWLKQYSKDMDEFQIINLPGDYENQSSDFAGKSMRYSLTETQRNKLYRQLVTRGVTLNMYLMAVYGIFLSKLSGSHDFAVGMPVENRANKIYDRSIGLFMNTLAVRIKVKESLSFYEYLKEIRQIMSSAYDNQEYGLEKLVEKIDLDVERSSMPLFRTMLVMRNHVFPAYEEDGLQWKVYNFELPVSKYDMVLEAEDGDCLELGFVYRAAKFKEETMQRFCRLFIRILEQVTEEPEVLIQDIEQLDQKEKKQILQEFNSTEVTYENGDTLAHIFHKQCRSNPEGIAVQFGNNQMTYLELHKKVASLSVKLRRAGCGADVVIGIMMERSFEMIIGILGIILAGGAYLPIDPGIPKDRKEFMLKDSGAKILLLNSAKENTDFFAGDVFYLSSTELYEDEEIEQLQYPSPHNLAYIIYTSGSTGLPKGVEIEHRSIVNRIHWMQSAYPITKEDRILQKTTYTFDVSVWELFWWMFTGAAAVFLEPGGEKNPEVIVREIKEKRITTIHFVPSMLSVFLEYVETKNAAKGLRTLKYVFASGEALTARHVNLFNEVLEGTTHGKLINLYGPTEAAVDVSHHLCGSERIWKSPPIGKPIGNIKLYIVDQYLKLCPVGISGEICISGIGLARGYRNRKELTYERFIDNPYYQKEADDGTGSYKRLYKTGDLGRWLPDGSVEYIGRMDHQIKIRGMRIELGEIEAGLFGCRGVQEAAVIQHEISADNKQLAAFLVMEKQTSVGEVKRELEQKLPSYMIPERFIPVESIPLTENGKSDKKKLKKLILPPEEVQEVVLPADSIQIQLEDVWSKLLSKKIIGIKDSFFDLGGNSILLIKMYNEIEKIYPGSVQITDLFSNYSIEKIANLIRNKNDTGVFHEEEYLRLPKDYFLHHPLSKKQRELQYVFQEKEVFLIREMISDANMEVYELFLTAYCYLLHIMAKAERIPVQVAIKHRWLDSIIVSVDGEAAIEELQSSIRNSLKEPLYTYAPDERKKGLRKETGSEYYVLPSFYGKNLTLDVKVKIDSCFDICLFIEEYGNKIIMSFTYNNRKIKEAAGVNLFDSMIQIINNRIIDYQTEAGKNT